MTPFVISCLQAAAFKVFVLPSDIFMENSAPSREESVTAVNVTVSPGAAMFGDAYVARTGSAAVTATLHDALPDPAEALIWAVPGATAYTYPFTTVATEVLLLAHVTETPDGFVDAFSQSVFPCGMLCDASDSVTAPLPVG